VLFHGSLQNAARISSERGWRPGAYCDAAAFHCSRWYPEAAAWLLNKHWRVLPAAALVADAAQAFESVGASERLFVRPDGPTKPFSGRVVARDAVSLEALDYGFYYEDDQLPVLIAPVVEVGREWRYVVVAGRVVAGSAYEANGRVATTDDPGREPWSFAQSIASALPAPESVYVLDLCESAGELRLLELNPFSGADLYACDAVAIISAVAAQL
jgi:hypothetical protein